MTDHNQTCYLCLFGEVTLFHPNSAGELEPRVIDGITCQALLTAMAIARRPRTRPELFHEVWTQYAAELDTIYTTTNRLKNELGSYKGVILASRKNIALTDDPTRLQTDWALFEDLITEERYAEALALARRGTPLAGVTSDHKCVGEFVTSLRRRALQNVLKACRASDRKTDFQWGDQIPDDWPRSCAGWPNLGNDTRSHFVEPTPATEMVPVRGLGVQPDGDWSSDDLFESCPDGRELFEKELAGARLGSATWWPEGTNEWFGEYYAFWHRTLTVPCEQIAIEYIPDRYDSSFYGVSSENDGDNDKAIIVGAKLILDNPRKRLVCARTTWNFAHEWAKENADDLLATPTPPSVFGLADRKPYPGIAGVHTLLQTSDGFLLFGLRAMQLDFHEGTWSASFEESVDASGRDFTGPVRGDATVLDTITGGLFEEWGIDSGKVASSSFLAVGREYVCTKQGRLDLSSSVLAAVRLNLKLAEVWESLADAPGIRDRDEHSAWAGVRFASRSQLLGFLAAARDRRDNIDLLAHLAGAVDAKLEFFPGGADSGIPDFGLMPTSAARLYLGTQWFVRYGWMEP